MPQDAGFQDSRDLEARDIAVRREAELSRESYDALVASYLDRTSHDEVVGATGSIYNIEVEAFWETPRQPGTLVVHVYVRSPEMALRGPVLREFLVSPDGHVVSKREPQWFRELDHVRRPVWLVFLYPAALAALAWFVWGHGTRDGTYYLVRGLTTAALVAILLAFRRWWVRRRRAGGGSGG